MTSAFGGQRSIQLSYGRPVPFLAEGDVSGNGAATKRRLTPARNWFRMMPEPGGSMRKFIIAVACAGCVIATGAVAQEFPSKNVTLMMPYAAGGPGDTLTRIIGQGMSKAMGRTFVVENTAGAAGTIGSLKVAQSPPDGHMLLVMHFGHAANIALYRNLRYDAVADFEPIGMIAESPMAARRICRSRASRS